MAMVIMNNGAAMQALQETNKNSNKLSKDLQKVASGMKINGAGDGAAEYAISEKMRVMVRSLGQDIENAKKGIDLVKMAEEGMRSIVNELRDMKAMAINSANDHNSEADRAILQKEFASRMESIDDIAATTNYNGKVLMDGRYWYTEYEEEAIINSAGNSSAINVTPARRLSTNNFSSVWGPPQMMRSRLLFGSTSSVPNLQPNTPAVDNDIQNLFPSSPMGYSALGIRGYMPNKTTDPDLPGSYVRLVTDSNGSFDPKLYKRTVSQTTEYTTSNMPQNGQTVYLEMGYNSYKACTFYNNGSEKYVISNDYSDISRGATRYKVELDFSGATKNGNALNIPSDLNNQSITILCKYCDQYVGIKMETGREAGTGVLYKPDSSYSGLYKKARVYVVGIGSDPCTQEEVLENIFKGIKAANAANGIRNYSDDNLTLAEHHAVSFYKSPLTGKYSFVKTAVENMVVYNGGMGSLSGGGEEEAQIEPDPPNPPEPDPPDPPEPDPPDPPEPDPPDPPEPDPPDPPEPDPPDPPEPDPPNPSEPDPPEPEKNEHGHRRRFEGNPLIIHYGPKQNQHLRVYINDMHTKAMGLEGVAVDPIEKALEAMGKLDEALQYALDEIVRMGAYQTKLQYTIDNNTVAEENVTRSESTIRDADMAQAMMNYVKDNVLTQSAQAMLAQANQNSSSVLSLLQ